MRRRVEPRIRHHRRKCGGDRSLTVRAGNQHGTETLVRITKTLEQELNVAKVVLDGTILVRQGKEVRNFSWRHLGLLGGNSFWAVSLHRNFVFAILFIAVADCSFALGGFLDQVGRSTGRALFRDGLVPKNEIAFWILRAAVKDFPAFGSPLDQFAAAP